jgi:hypothetical protein
LFPAHPVHITITGDKNISIHEILQWHLERFSQLALWSDFLKWDSGLAEDSSGRERAYINVATFIAAPIVALEVAGTNGYSDFCHVAETE